jgi:hypothetical protein
LGAFSLWVFICLWITIPLSTVKESAWHYKILIGRPKGNCVYFWLLLISPLTGILMIAIAAVAMVAFTLSRLLFDWLIMPICGKRVKGVLTQGYWKGFLELPDERLCEYAEFRYRSYWIGMVSVLALITWISVGYFCFYKLVITKEWISDLASIGTVAWIFITFIALYVGLLIFFEDSEKWHDFKEGAGLISGKLCRQLKYEVSESNDKD